jgi:outer membrane protein assembly factor BamB
VYGGVGQDAVAVRDEGASGRILWRGHTRGLVEVSTAVAADGTVLVGSNDKRLHAFGPDGRPRWAAPLRSLTYSSPAVAVDGTVVVGDHRGAVSRLRVADGTLVARHVGIPQTPRRRSVGVWTAPALDARGDVYFGTRLGHVYGFTREGRRLLDVRTGATADSNPALGPDGTLYAGSEDGRLYAIGGG